jgi:TolB-like protein/Tfp pilus assembly protein PilF
MQYLEGQTLKQIIQKAPLDVNQILDIGSQIATGLEKAHEKGIIHRDIKPANIIITPDNLAKILDFGLAKLVEDQKSTPQERQTDVDKAIGTTLYMSPEQVRGNNLDSRTDLFSLGVILYEMATGKIPYSGTTSGAVFDEVLNKLPPPPTRINPDVPDDLERIIVKCMEKDPDLRYQSARELLADMRRMMRGPDLSMSVITEPLLSPVKQKMFWKIAPAVVLGLLGIAMVLWGSGLFETAPVNSSVGVLPFENASGDVAQDALADGLSEDIVAQLTKISGLNVYRFKGFEGSPEDKAAELGIGTLLEGKIRRIGGNVRISAQLNEAQSGRVLWSENYDRDLKDVFALQDEIALEVAAALEVELLPEEKREVAASPTQNIEAYDLYLRGRFLRHTQENPEGLRQAVNYFQQAIEKDNSYALAYAGLAECYFMLASIYGAEPWEKFGEAAATAVHFGDSLPEPHVAMGLWSDFWENDPEFAETQFKRALEIDPRHSNARREYARFLMRRGRFDESLVEIEKVRDPMFSVTYHLTRSEIFRYRGQFAEAIKEAKQFQDIWSGSDEPYLQQALCYIYLIEYQKALDLAEIISDDHPAHFRILGLIYLLQNRLDEAAEACRRLVSLQPDIPFTWWLSGNLALWEQDYQAALENFEKANQLKTRDDLNWWRPYTTYLGFTCLKLGKTQQAEQYFAISEASNLEAMRNGNQNPELRRDMAVIQAIRGEKEEALQWLVQAVATGSTLYDLTLKDEMLESLYDHPRFQELLAEVSLKIERMRLEVEKIEANPRAFIGIQMPVLNHKGL